MRNLKPVRKLRQSIPPSGRLLSSRLVSDPRPSSPPPPLHTHKQLGSSKKFKEVQNVYQKDQQHVVANRRKPYIIQHLHLVLVNRQSRKPTQSSGVENATLNHRSQPHIVYPCSQRQGIIFAGQEGSPTHSDITLEIKPTPQHRNSNSLVAWYKTRHQRTL